MIATCVLAGTAWADAQAPNPASGGMRMRAPDQQHLTAPAPAAPAAAVPAPGSARARVAAELSEEAVPLPGGGMKINLRGNFRAAVTRSVGDGGPTGHACTEPGSARNE